MSSAVCRLPLRAGASSMQPVQLLCVQSVAGICQNAKYIDGSSSMHVSASTASAVMPLGRASRLGARHASTAPSKGQKGKLLAPEAPPMLDSESKVKRRIVPAGEMQNALQADPYGWAPEDRSIREMPLWMVLETEREEIKLPKETESKHKAGAEIGAELEIPQLDANGRAYGTGRRKTSTSRVYVKPGDGKWTVNGRDFSEYFTRLLHRRQAMEPFLVTQSAGAFDVQCSVTGGGPTGQAGAVRHGLAKALAAYDPYLKPLLQSFGLLRRDPRMVERKKPGQAKARRKFQWVKR